MRKRRRILLTIDELRVWRSRDFELYIPYLRIMPGTVTCIVGANGSGKTTLMESLVGLLPKRSGTVQVCGRDAHLDDPAVKRAVGYIPDDDGWIIPELTAREYLALLVQVQDEASNKWLLQNRIEHLAQQLLFTSFDQQLGSLSHGNKKKVQIIAALLHDPHFIIVDELRNGLDPIAIHRAEQLLAQRSIAGAAVIAATHDLWWAERFAHEIIMIRRGIVILNDYTQNIVEQAGSIEARFMELYDQATC